MLRSGGSLDGVALNTTDLVTFVTLTLVTSSGWNGDLYAYLEHKGAITVLLNRAGLTAGNSAGAVSNGMNVTFSDAATVDVHTGLSNTTKGQAFSQSLFLPFIPRAGSSSP